MKFNKTLLIYLLLVTTSTVIAQNNAKEFEVINDYKVDTFLLNFSIPDMPAFKALGTEPSEILRPSDIQKFAIQMNPFFSSNGSGVIPKSFAMEVAPWKLLSKNWTLNDYRKSPGKRLAYNTSFSLGTLQEDVDNPETKIAIGVRTSFRFNGADPMNDTNFFDSLAVYAKAIEEKRVEHLAKWRKDNGISRIEYLGSDSLQTAFATSFRKLKANKAVNSYIEQYKKDNWNASRFDLALAIVGASSDSLIKNTEFDAFHAWATMALKAGKSGQWLIGAVFKQDTDLDPECTISSRLYLGNANFRTYVEYQTELGFGDNDATGWANLGTELRVGQKFWLEFYGGIEDVYSTSNDSRFKSTLNVRYSFNN